METQRRRASFDSVEGIINAAVKYKKEGTEYWRFKSRIQEKLLTMYNSDYLQFIFPNEFAEQLNANRVSV